MPRERGHTKGVGWPGLNCIPTLHRRCYTSTCPGASTTVRGSAPRASSLPTCNDGATAMCGPRRSRCKADENPHTCPEHQGLAKCLTRCRSFAGSGHTPKPNGAAPRPSRLVLRSFLHRLFLSFPMYCRKGSEDVFRTLAAVRTDCVSRRWDQHDPRALP
jgi:hypothetical protein